MFPTCFFSNESRCSFSRRRGSGGWMYRGYGGVLKPPCRGFQGVFAVFLRLHQLLYACLRVCLCVCSFACCLVLWLFVWLFVRCAVLLACLFVCLFIVSYFPFCVSVYFIHPLKKNEKTKKQTNKQTNEQTKNSPVFYDVVDEGALADVGRSDHVDVAVPTQRLFPRLSVHSSKKKSTRNKKKQKTGNMK